MSSAYIKQSSCCEFMNEKTLPYTLYYWGVCNPGGFVLDPSILIIQLLSSLLLTKPTTYIMNGSDDNLSAYRFPNCTCRGLLLYRCWHWAGKNVL
jgi:hypothetical protein